MIIFVIFWIIIIVCMRKSVKISKDGTNSGNYGNISMRISKYDTIIERDRYSSVDKIAAELKIPGPVVINELKKLISTGRYKGVEIDETNGIIRYSSNTIHNHAYKHKVEPIDKATVVKNRENTDKTEDNKDSSMNLWDESIDNSLNSKLSQYRMENKTKDDMKKNNRLAGKNGDNGYMPQANEEQIKCDYCGALNILPAYRNGEYTCYFCREIISK